MIKSHTNLVKKIAWHIYGRTSHAIEIEDVIQIGFAALVNAAQTYTKQEGATFATYASIRIKGDIIDHLRKASNLCRTTIKMKKRYNKALTTLQGRLFREPTAEEISAIFTEVVIAPGADDAARAVFAKKKNLRLLTTDGLADAKAAGQTIRQVAGGYLFQDKDNGFITLGDLKVVTKRAPTEQELSDLMFAWTVAKHVKSNAIIYVKDGATVGVGAGQMSRVDSTRIAARKAIDMAEAMGLPAPLTKGSVVASDAFFPFADGLITAAEAGATALIQPGGSMRDDEVIAAADEAGLAMVFTGMRHFRH